MIRIVPNKKDGPDEIEAVINDSWSNLLELIAKYQNPDEAFKARVVRKGDYIHFARQDEWEGRSVGND